MHFLLSTFLHTIFYMLKQRGMLDIKQIRTKKRVEPKNRLNFKFNIFCGGTIAFQNYS